MRPLRRSFLIVLICSCLVWLAAPGWASPTATDSTGPAPASALEDSGETPAGQMRTPVAGARLLGHVDLEWYSGAVSRLSPIEVEISGCPHSWQLDQLDDGRIRQGADVSDCVPGEQVLTATGSYAYNMGGDHPFSQSFPVTVLGGPTAVALTSSVIQTYPLTTPHPTVTLRGEDTTQPATWQIQCRAVIGQAKLRFRVLDKDHAVVRSFAHTFAPGDRPCTTRESFSDSWDGRDDNGDLVPDGTYEFVADLTGADGDTATDHQSVDVDLRNPAPLVSPVADSELSDSVVLEWRQVAGITPRSISAALSGCGGWYAQLGSAGPPALRFDASTCWSGAQKLSWVVTWADEFGQVHTYRGEIPVQVLDETAPRLALNNPQPIVVSRWRGSELGWTYWSYACSDQSPTEVKTTITTTGGELVRTLEQPDPRECQYGHGLTTRWGGTDAAGAEVPDGRYVGQATATDSGGLTTTITFDVIKDTRPPAILSGVRPGDRIEADDKLVWTPRDGADIKDVTVSLSGRCSLVKSLDRDDEGRFVLKNFGDAGCVGGELFVNWTASWVDLSGQHRWYEDTVKFTGADSTPPLLDASGARSRVVMLSGPDHLGAVSLRIACQDQSSVTYVVSIHDDQGDLVRTWPPAKLAKDADYFDHEWDGTDSRGEQVADGTYQVSVVATDAGGLSAETTFGVRVDSRTPGHLDGVADGDRLAPDRRLRFVPDPEFPGEITRVQVDTTAQDVSASGEGREAGADGSWPVSMSAEVRSGDNTLTWSVSWVDGAGHSYTYTSRPIKITVVRAVPAEPSPTAKPTPDRAKIRSAPSRTHHPPSATKKPSRPRAHLR